MLVIRDLLIRVVNFENEIGLLLAVLRIEYIQWFIKETWCNKSHITVQKQSLIDKSEVVL